MLRAVDELRLRSSAWDCFGLEQGTYERAAARLATDGAWAQSEELQICATVFGVGLHVFGAAARALGEHADGGAAARETWPSRCGELTLLRSTVVAASSAPPRHEVSGRRLPWTKRERRPSWTF